MKQKGKQYKDVNGNNCCFQKAILKKLQWIMVEMKKEKKDMEVILPTIKRNSPNVVIQCPITS